MTFRSSNFKVNPKQKEKQKEKLKTQYMIEKQKRKEEESQRLAVLTKTFKTGKYYIAYENTPVFLLDIKKTGRQSRNRHLFELTMLIGITIQKHWFTDKHILKNFQLLEE